MKHARPIRPLPEIVVDRLDEIRQNQADLAATIRRLKGLPPKQGYTGLISSILNSRRSIPTADVDIWIRALRWHGDEAEVAEFRQAAREQRAGQVHSSRPVVADIRAIREENARLLQELERLRGKRSQPPPSH